MAFAHDAPQLSAPVSDRAPQVQMAMDYIQQYHVPGISWHTTLNNHASTRPKAYGGKLVDSLTECKAFEQSLWKGEIGVEQVGVVPQLRC